jgi:histidyl-tRNA synthetase
MATRSLADVEKLLEDAKACKRATKGDPAKEKELTETLKLLNLERVALMKSPLDDNKKFVLKVPKGTRDFNDCEMALRELMFSKIKAVFKRYLL